MTSRYRLGWTRFENASHIDSQAVCSLTPERENTPDHQLGGVFASEAWEFVLPCP